MASSSTYWRKYEKARDRYNKYKDYASDLKKVLDNFSDWKLGSRKDMNTDIKNTVKNLKDAVKGLSRYTSNVEDFNNAKESSYTSDSKLSAAKSQIQAEYDEMVRERDDAKDDKDYYWDMYVAAKADEIKEAIAGD